MDTTTRDEKKGDLRASWVDGLANDQRREIENERSLEKWGKRCTNHFTKKTKRMLFEEIDNVVWSGNESEIARWCKRNKVYDEITENEIDEIWKKGGPHDDEGID